MADSASIWIMILLRKVRTWLYQQYLKWFQTTSVHHQHHHHSTCICFLRSIKLATLVDQIIVSACCCSTKNIAFYLDQIMCPLVHNLSTYVNQWFQFGQHNDSQTLPLHHGHKNNIYCYPITVALKRYLISSTSIPFLTHLQEHMCTLQSFFVCFFFIFNKHPILDPPTGAYVHTTKFFCVLFFHGVCKPFTVSNVLVTPLMKGQTQNVCRGTQTTRKHFCPLFFVEHSFTYRYVIQLNLSQKNN